MPRKPKPPPKPPRRARNSGSIVFHRPSGRWYARPPEGIPKPDHGFATREEAAAWLDPRVAALRRTGAAPLAVGAYLARWLARTAASSRWADATIADYHSAIRALGPAILAMPLADLTRATLQDRVAVLAPATRRRFRDPETGALAPRRPTGQYVRSLADVWRRAFADAVEDELLARNPATRLALPPATPPTRPAWTRDEVRALYAVLPGHRMAPLIGLCLAGLRIGEALALAWADVDLARGLVTLRDTKTRVDRVHALPPRTVALLAAHRDRQPASWRYVANHLYHGRVCRYVYKSVRRELRKLAREAGIRDYPTHAGRRSVGTALSAAGVPLADVGQVLGHADARTTARSYVQNTSEGAERALAILSELFGEDED